MDWNYHIIMIICLIYIIVFYVILNCTNHADDANWIYFEIEKQYPLVFLLYTLFSVPDEGDSRNALLAHLAKGNVSFCHHLASVSVRPS